MKGFSRQQLEATGFYYVLSKLEPCCCYGEEKKRDVDWFSRDEKDELDCQLHQLSEAVRIQASEPELIEGIKGILHRFTEIRRILRKIEGRMEFLDETELFELKNFALDMEYLRSAVERARINLGSLVPHPAQPVIRLLNPEAQVTRTFSIYDSYSAELAAVRREKKEIEKQITAMAGDASELLQKRHEIVERERREENAVKQTLTRSLVPYADELKMDTQYIAALDFILAKSSLAIQNQCSQPTFWESELIDAVDLINPLVESILQKNGKRFTPINIQLGNGTNVLTGANMGGKTVALATITLNILLAHCGFFIFGKTLNLPVMDSLFYLSQDQQSISEGLSSFGAEVKAITGLIQEMREKRVFCALDEFARGTNPDEGVMMVRAFLQLAERYRTFCLLATHYNGVLSEGMNHFQVVGLKKADLSNLSASKGKQTFGFLQELMDFNIEAVDWDSPPPRDALRVAELMGVQEEFLDLVKENSREK